MSASLAGLWILFPFASFDPSVSSLLPLALAIVEAITFDPEPAHLVGIGGAFGALARHWVYERLEADGFPTATFVVNVLGSVCFGALLFLEVSASTAALLGTGFCGAFTTFSTFAVETVRCWEDGDRRLAATNALANLLVCVGGIGLAWLVVSSLP